VSAAQIKLAGQWIFFASVVITTDFMGNLPYDITERAEKKQRSAKENKLYIVLLHDICCSGGDIYAEKNHSD